MIATTNFPNSHMRLFHHSMSPDGRESRFYLYVFKHTTRFRLLFPRCPKHPQLEDSKSSYKHGRRKDFSRGGDNSGNFQK